jgi:hypothetical protein
MSPDKRLCTSAFQQFSADIAFESCDTNGSLRFIQINSVHQRTVFLLGWSYVIWGERSPRAVLQRLCVKHAVKVKCSSSLVVLGNHQPQKAFDGVKCVTAKSICVGSTHQPQLEINPLLLLKQIDPATELFSKAH